jgi:SMI1 / KNR4 family (SUKH-1)
MIKLSVVLVTAVAHRSMAGTNKHWWACSKSIYRLGLIMLLVTNELPASQDRIKAVETAFGVELPDDYRNFLARHDGGKINASGIVLSDGRTATISRLYSTRENESYSLLEGLKYHMEFYPDGFRPIGESSNGDKLLIGTKGEYRGKIFYYLHDREAENPIDLAEDIEMIFPSFSEFERNISK